LQQKVVQYSTVPADFHHHHLHLHHKVVTCTPYTNPPANLSDSQRATTPDPGSVLARAPCVRFHRVGLPVVVSSVGAVLLLPCMAQEGT
jgi:hypothetical protein